MLYICFLACTKVELWDLTVCIVVNGEKFRSRTVTLTLVQQCPLSNLSEIFSYTKMCSNFMFHNLIILQNLMCCRHCVLAHLQTVTFLDILYYHSDAIAREFKSIDTREVQIFVHPLR